MKFMAESCQLFIGAQPRRLYSLAHAATVSDTLSTAYRQSYEYLNPPARVLEFYIYIEGNGDQTIRKDGDSSFKAGLASISDVRLALKVDSVLAVPQSHEVDAATATTIARV